MDSRLSKIYYPLKPWLIQCILDGEHYNSPKLLQIIKHYEGPLKDGTVIKVVSDGKTFINAYFLSTSFSRLDDSERENWEWSLIKVNDWDINLVLMSNEESSDYMIVIKSFEVWNTEQGYWNRDKLSSCKTDTRILELISKVWEECRKKKSATESKPLNMLINALQAGCPSQDSSSTLPVAGNVIYNQGLLSTITIEDLENNLTVVNLEDFLIKPEEDELLEAIPEWNEDSFHDTSSVLKSSVSCSSNTLEASTSTSKLNAENGIELPLTKTKTDEETCTTQEPNICEKQENISSEVKTDSENPLETVNYEKETNRESNAQSEIASEDGEMIVNDVPQSKERQPDNDLVSVAAAHCQNRVKITSQSNNSDIEEETRLRNLTLPTDEAAGQQDRPASQHENDLSNSEDSLLKVTSTDNDEYKCSSLEFSTSNKDSTRNVLNNCDISQEKNSNNEANPPGPSFLVTSTANELLPPTNAPASPELTAFNYNDDSNLPFPQNSNYSNNDTNSDNVNLNENELVSSTAKEPQNPELRNLCLLKRNPNKRTFSIYQMDSRDNRSDYTQSHEGKFSASPSKRTHIEPQDNTEQQSLDALLKLKSLQKIPPMSADQMLLTSLKFTENVLANINTFWSNSSTHPIQ